MLISTRGRYALRVMADLAEHECDGFIPMKDVAERQGMSLKYIGAIMPLLTKSGLVDGIHGKGGGYKLSKHPKEYSLGEILRVTEGDLAPVMCLKKGAQPCEKKDKCATIGLWCELEDVINNFLNGKTLADLMK